MSPPAHAATFTVTNPNDSDPGSLRQAITDANAAVGADIITFSISGTIPLDSTLPTITDTTGLTIDGTGQTVTISGGNAVRVLFVDTGASLSLNNLTIANGKVSSGNHGGGIMNSGTLTITNSSFSGNSTTSGGSGSGIYNNSGAVTITNSIFSGNSMIFGGGIYNLGTLTITNNTFSGNSANPIYNAAGTVTLRNTIVANGTSGGNCIGTITNGGNNIDDGTSCGWGATSGSMSSTNPLLGPLANNGGPTQTFALLVGSPAIDGVTFNAPNGAPSTDQRGVPRPQGVRYDIGTYETTRQSGPNFVVNTNTDPGDGVCEYAPAGDCTLREAINAANTAAGDNTITVPAGIYTLTIAGTGEDAAATGDLDLTSNISINGAGAGITIIDGGALDRVFHVTDTVTVNISGVTIRNGNVTTDNGGGIFNPTSTLTIANSAFSGNSATLGYGGGIFNNVGTLTLTNCTVFGNSAPSDRGGGIFNNAGAVTITNSTFSGNSAANGVIYNGIGAVTLSNTIIANSTSGGNCSGAFINGGNNIDDGTTCGWGSTNGSMSSTNPLLGPLANNGGPTMPFALLSGSPAINGVTFNAPNGAPSTDQRGVGRPRGAGYDIGAYERNVPDLSWLMLLLD